MNRNIRRKQPSDVDMLLKKFVDGLPEEDRDKTCLTIFNTPKDKNGTDLVLALIRFT